MDVRHLPLLVVLLLPASCAAPPPPRHAPAARPPAAPAWRPVPVRPDGVRVEGGRMHSVKRGETGVAIAQAYRVPWSRIAAANRVERDGVLRVGQSLFIPMDLPAPGPAARRGAPPRAMTPEQRAAAFTLDIDDLVTGSAVAVETPAAQASAAPAARPGPAAPAAPVRRPAADGPVPRLSWPVDGRVILSRYGAKPGGRFNDGINIKALRGQTVRAAADGEVIYVGDAIAGFGLLMLVRHPGGTVTAYGHLDSAIASRGDRVSGGQPIARAGATGAVREPQLLFEVRQGRRALDPLQFLPS